MIPFLECIYNVEGEHFAISPNFAPLPCQILIGAVMRGGETEWHATLLVVVVICFKFAHIYVETHAYQYVWPSMLTRLMHNISL